MARNDRFDGFTVNLLQDEDGDWIAHFAELPHISAAGPTPEQALSELATAWKLVKSDLRADKEPIPIAPARRNYSGQFNVRIDKRLHRDLAMEAARYGLSLNALVAQKLTQMTR
jgi:predicted HicB family RNase H-like nuclease